MIVCASLDHTVTILRIWLKNSKFMLVVGATKVSIATNLILHHLATAQTARATSGADCTLF